MKQCLTCKEWNGDRVRTNNLIAQWGAVVMDPERGFSGSGGCGIAHEWAEIEIHGDATFTMAVPANFGCIFHKPI